MVNGPLAGRTVAVTRPKPNAGPLRQCLTTAGASVVHVPLIAIELPSDDGAGLRAAAERLTEFAWVVLTSANGVAALAAVAAPPSSPPPQWAAVGTATADALAEWGISPSLVPGRQDTVGIAAEMPRPEPGEALLLVQAEDPAAALEANLASLGWRVEKVDAYRTVAVAPEPDELERLAGADVVTLASPSAAANLAGLNLLGVPVVCIGPSTAIAARDHGLTVAGVAESPAPEAFTRAVITAVGLKP